MLNLPLPVRVYLCLEPTDMRRSFDGLCRMVREFVGADPLSGDLFVFRSKRGDRLLPRVTLWLLHNLLNNRRSLPLRSTHQPLRMKSSTRTNSPRG